ncbi:MAG: hypothetical protein MHPSP_002942, partial [Paramarteilia canceri]
NKKTQNHHTQTKEKVVSHNVLVEKEKLTFDFSKLKNRYMKLQEKYDEMSEENKSL